MPLVVFICVPVDRTIDIFSMIDIGWIQKGMSDIEQTWEISLAVAGIAFVAS